VKYLIIFLTLLSLGCTQPKPINTVPNLDLDRFMGKWYVIANIPTFLEKDAHNATEIYELKENGKIKTTFKFNDGAFDGEIKEYDFIANVIDNKSNAIWEMQFIWPLKSDYRVLYIDDKYNTTVIGRLKRDYVWIMSRSTEINSEKLQSLMRLIDREGYNSQHIQLVPHENQPRKLAWRT